MSDSINKDGSQKLAAGLLLIVGLLIVGGGVWFVLGPGTPVYSSEVTHQSETQSTPAHAIEAALAAARSYRSSEEFAKAEAVLRAAVEEHVEDQALRLAYAEVLLDLEKTDLAYQQYQAALAIGPRDSMIEFNAGTLAMATSQPERALEHYSMARAADPTNAEIALFLGAVQQQLGLTNEAKASLLSSMQLDDSRAEAAAMLAQMSLDENDTSLALRYIRQARVAEPTQIAHRILESRVLRRMNKPDEALTLLMALPPEQLYNPMILDICGACFGLIGKATDAAQLYEDAMNFDTSEPEFAYQAALWNERAGDTKRAFELAKRASMLGHEQANNLAARLESDG
jgi:Tfp pilus assembly protein PilF